MGVEKSKANSDTMMNKMEEIAMMVYGLCEMHAKEMSKD